MRNIRVYLICTILNLLLLVFSSFYFFAKNLSEPVKENTYIPFEGLYLYELLENGEVSVHIINILIYSVVLAIPVFFLLKFFSQIITKKLINKGNL